MLRKSTCLTGLVWLCALGTSSAFAQESMQAILNDSRYSFTPFERETAQRQMAALTELNIRIGQCVQLPGGCPADLTAQQARLNDFDNTAQEIVNNTSNPGGPGTQRAARTLAIGWRQQAPEEFSSQRSAMTEFADNQAAGLMNRLSALRGGASGFAVNGMELTPAVAQSQREIQRGGGASADTPLGSRWGGFVNGSYGWGERESTDYEDGFDIDSAELTVGADYRINSQWVAGLALGYIDQSLEFDASQGLTDGGFDSKGYSVTAYGLFEMDGPYVSGSLGWQMLDHDSTRRIRYQLITSSGGTTTPLIDETQRGSTDSSMLTAIVDAGWSLHTGAFGYEPYVRVEYRDATIDGFRESGFSNISPTPGFYAMNVAERTVKSTLGVVGFKGQYTFTPSFGVIVPYLKAEYRNEFEDSPTETQAYYNAFGSAAPTASATFDTPSDVPDSSYAAAIVGTSLVFRGGWQGFVQYQGIFGLEHVDSSTVTLGVRGEF